MSESIFQVNEFRTYQVVRDGVSFGFIDPANGGYTPKHGEKFQYDGSTVILHDGREFRDAPQLRSAIREGWCTQVGSKVTTYRPKSAGIQVRPTETRGTERAVKTTIETQRAEERSVVSVEDRKRSREAANAEATRRVPLQSQEAQGAVAAAARGWSSGDEEIDEIAGILDEAMGLLKTEGEPYVDDEPDPEDEVRAQAEADILDMLNSVEGDPEPASSSKRKAAARPRTRPPISAHTKTATPSDFSMPIENQDARPAMPIIREDSMANTGAVVGSVADQNKVVVEREQEFALDVAQAKPPNQSPAPKPRFGGVGAIVHDEQRDMGTIALSDSKPAIKLDESASVTSSGNETIRMGDQAQVGGHKKTAVRAPETDQGVAVGRILSPTRQSFVADSRNTSAAAIQRTAEGGRVKVEKYDVAEDQVEAETTQTKEASAVATGDVQEVIAGDTLEELLPDAAKPEPEVHRRPEDDPAYEAVRMLIPDFEWNKDRPVRERVADALKRVKEPMYVKGILAVETELAREEIKKGLSQLLSKKKAAKKKTKKAVT